MQRRKKAALAISRPRTKKFETAAMVQSANGYIVRHYPFGCLAGEPQRLTGQREFWIVPVLLTSPGYGEVGEVGLVAVDGPTRQIVSATTRQEATRAIKHLKESKRDELEAAFHRARTV